MTVRGAGAGGMGLMGESFLVLFCKKERAWLALEAWVLRVARPSPRRWSALQPKPASGRGGRKGGIRLTHKYEEV